MKKIYDNIAELVGNTPLIRLHRLEKAYNVKAKIYAKLEYLNPTGSAKDRAALEMLNAAEARGEIDRDTVIIEPTSGNTGIGLAAVGATRGYRTIIVMPSTMSKERIALMKVYGAEVILSDGALGMNGAIQKANELREGFEKAFIPSQFDNPDNSAAHYKTTGPEIYDALGDNIDYFVAGVGTGGTITGTGRYLKERIPDIKVIAVEPSDSAVLSGNPAGAHAIAGIGAGFIPSILDTGIYDSIIPVTKDDAYTLARALGKNEGIGCGISAGAALFAAIKIASHGDADGKSIVVFLPDGADRYLSTDLFI